MVSSRRIFGVTGLPLAGTVTLLYTVPAGFVAIFRAITFVNAGVAVTAARLYVNGVGVGDMYWRGSVPLNSTILAPYLVLNPGDLLYGSVTAGGDIIRVMGVGSLLEV